MWYQIKSYIRFLLRSKNQHGIHSPFVYDLVTNCFYDKTKFTEFVALKKFRKKIFQNHELIEINDFGEGSRVFNSNKRKVSAIAKNAGITFKRQKLLFRITKYFKPETVLELGTSLGLGTVAIELADPSVSIDTIEGCQNTALKAQEYFDESNLKCIQLFKMTFEDYFIKNPSRKFDLVYIDGNHNKEKTLQYFEILLNKINDDSVLIFDDIYWSSTMTEAWLQIIQHPNVTVSIDTFFWGFIFFRREQQKQHFTIRL